MARIISSNENKEGIYQVSLIDSLAYVGTSTSDVGTWRDYATSVLGLQVSPDSDNKLLYLRADGRHHRLTVHEGHEDDVAYVGWQVHSPEGLESAAASLTKHGVNVYPGSSEDKSNRHVMDLIYFDCPYTGVRMEICWGHEQLFMPRFRPARDLGGFETETGGMGHVVLYAEDVLAATQFYREALGFGVSDFSVIPGAPAPLAAFLHCNERHHSLAFMGAPNPPRRLQHVMFQTASLDDVGSTYDVCRESGLTTTSIGRHYNDHAVSFYFRNPSGWHFEFAWDPRTIDPVSWQTEHYVVGRPGVEWGHEGLFEMR
jgi:extradiol dioxygenase